MKIHLPVAINSLSPSINHDFLDEKKKIKFLFLMMYYGLSNLKHTFTLFTENVNLQNP